MYIGLCRVPEALGKEAESGSESVMVWVSIVHDFLGNSMPFSMHASSTFSEKKNTTGPAGQRGNLSKCLWPGAQNPSSKIAVRSSGAHSERSK